MSVSTADVNFDFDINNGPSSFPNLTTTINATVPESEDPEPEGTFIVPPDVPSVYGLVKFNRYQSVAQEKSKLFTHPSEPHSMGSFQVLKMREPIPISILLRDISYDVTSLPSGHFLLSPSRPIHRPNLEPIDRTAQVDLDSEKGKSIADLDPTEQFENELIEMRRRLKKVKKRSRRKRTIFGIKNKISAVGSGTKEGDTNLDHVQNTRVAVSRTGPASNGPSPAQVPAATNAPVAPPVSLPQNPPTQYIYVTDQNSLQNSGPVPPSQTIVNRHPRQHIQLRGPRVDSGYELETQTTFDTRGNFASSRSSHSRSDKLLYHRLYNDLYDQLTSDINYLLENQYSRSYVRPRSRRSVVEDMNPYEDNGNVSADDHETPLHSYISIDSPLGRYSIFHVPSNHKDATNAFSISFQNGTLNVDGENVTHDGEILRHPSGPTTIHISQTDENPSQVSNSTQSNAFNSVTNQKPSLSLNAVGFTNLAVAAILTFAVVIGGILCCRRRCSRSDGEAAGRIHLI